MAKAKEADELAEGAGVSNMVVLLDKMIAMKADPEALKKMMDLAERWEQNQAKKAFTAAMQKCQEEMPAVIKNEENRFLSKADKAVMFATLDAMQAVVKPVYTRHGFSPSWSQADPPREGWVRLVLRLHHVGGHTEHYQGDYPQDGTGMKGGSNMNAIQGVVSSCTYGQRNLLQMAFNITVAGDDRDGNAQQPLIGPDEIKVINDLLGDCREAGDEVNFQLLLKFAAPPRTPPLESLDQMPLSEFSRVVGSLAGKLRKALKEREAT